jgi:hypothetical protein
MNNETYSVDAARRGYSLIIPSFRVRGRCVLLCSSVGGDCHIVCNLMVLLPGWKSEHLSQLSDQFTSFAASMKRAHPLPIQTRILHVHVVDETSSFSITQSAMAHVHRRLCGGDNDKCIGIWWLPSTSSSPARLDDHAVQGTQG